MCNVKWFCEGLFLLVFVVRWILLKFGGQQFFQFYLVGGEFVDVIGQFVGGYCIFVVFLVEGWFVDWFWMWCVGVGVFQCVWQWFIVGIEFFQQVWVDCEVIVIGQCMDLFCIVEVCVYYYGFEVVVFVLVVDVLY